MLAPTDPITTEDDRPDEDQWTIRIVDSVESLAVDSFRPKIINENKSIRSCPYVGWHTIPFDERHSEDHFFKYGCIMKDLDLTANFRRCIYNYSHHVPVGGMEQHLKTCQSYWKYVIFETNNPLPRLEGIDPRPVSVHIPTLLPKIPDPVKQPYSFKDFSDAARKYLWKELKSYGLCASVLGLVTMWLTRKSKINH